MAYMLYCLILSNVYKPCHSLNWDLIMDLYLEAYCISLSFPDYLLLSARLAAMCIQQHILLSPRDLQSYEGGPQGRTPDHVNSIFKLYLYAFICTCIILFVQGSIHDKADYIESKSY